MSNGTDFCGHGTWVREDGASGSGSGSGSGNSACRGSSSGAGSHRGSSTGSGAAASTCKAGSGSASGGSACHGSSSATASSAGSGGGSTCQGSSSGSGTATQVCSARGSGAPSAAGSGTNTVATHVNYSITSQTVYDKPPLDRTRNTIGVGEVVILTLTPDTCVASGSGNGASSSVSWQASGGKISAAPGAASASTSGMVVAFNAPGRGGVFTIKATCDGSTASITFTVIEPDGVHMERDPNTGVRHIQGFPTIGVKPIVYITPDTVSFQNIRITEGDAVGVVTGYFVTAKDLHNNSINGLPHAGHGANQPPAKVGDVFAGKGSMLMSTAKPGEPATDIVQGGGSFSPPWQGGGTFTRPIPWKYFVGSEPEVTFKIVNEVFTMDGNGSMSASKGGLDVGPVGLDNVTSYYSATDL
jgi:hypothetical protein